MTGPGGRDRNPGAVGERSPRTPEQQRRAAERARLLRERRAAARAERDGAAGPPAERTRRRRATTETGSTDRQAGDDAPHADVETAGEPPAAADTAGTRRYRRRRVVAGLLGVGLVLVAVAVGLWWALGRFGPDVAQVRVSGNRAVSTADVQTAASVEPGTPLASVDTAGVQARVAAIPGVATVEVARSWPDAVTVAITERAPVAVADAPGGRRLVDATGLAYRAAGPTPPRVPLLALPRVAPDDPATLAAVGMLAALPGPVRGQVDTVALGAGGTTLELTLTEGRRVLWGRWSETAAAPARAAVLGPLLSREGSVYDVSSPALPTVRP